MSRPLADALSKLLKSDNGLASSQFTVAQRCALEEFSRKTQAVRLITQGRGTVYRVFERTVAVAHLKQMRPMQAEGLSAALPRRAANLALYRNSKAAAAGHALQYLLFKSINVDARWQNEQGYTMDLPAQQHHVDE